MLDAFEDQGDLRIVAQNFHAVGGVVILVIGGSGRLGGCVADFSLGVALEHPAVGAGGNAPALIGQEFVEGVGFGFGVRAGAGELQQDDEAVAADAREIADAGGPGVGIMETGGAHGLQHDVAGGGDADDGFVEEVGGAAADGDFDPIGHLLVPEGGGEGDGAAFLSTTG